MHQMEAIQRCHCCFMVSIGSCRYYLSHILTLFLCVQCASGSNVGGSCCCGVAATRRRCYLKTMATASSNKSTWPFCIRCGPVSWICNATSGVGHFTSVKRCRQATLRPVRKLCSGYINCSALALKSLYLNPISIHVFGPIQVHCMRSTW